MINNFDDIFLDVLREIGNVGSGNAATALATMIDKKIDMAVPRVNILDFKDVSKILGDIEKPIVGIYFEMSGDIEGNIMFTLDIESAKNLVNMLFGREESEVDEEDEMSEMDVSALSEVGNILAASYINSLSQLTQLNLKISVPSVAIDMAGAVLSVPAIQFGHIGDQAIFIETQFDEGGRTISGDLFLVPEIDSYDILFRSLGIIQ